MSDQFPEQFSDQARADFQRARFKAFVNRVWGSLSGQPSTLLSYDEIKEKLHIGGRIYRGVKTVRVDLTAGRLSCCRELDRVLLRATANRREHGWRGNRVCYQWSSSTRVVG